MSPGRQWGQREFQGTRMMSIRATPTPLAVTWSTAGCESRARTLAEGLHAVLVRPDGPFLDGALALAVKPNGLQLEAPGERDLGVVRLDFVEGRNGHRRRFGGGRGQPLARAVGLKQGRIPSVLDATAGSGRDAFVLAALGCRVMLVERSPVIAALLEDALARAAADAGTAPVIARMTLVRAEAVECMAALSEADRPDVVYLDPMYPHRTKTALVKKEMRMFRRLVGDDQDSPRLLSGALAVARQRVVVKRPAKAEPVAGPRPTMAIRSPNTRYDVYII